MTVALRGEDSMVVVETEGPAGEKTEVDLVEEVEMTK